MHFSTKLKLWHISKHSTKGFPRKQFATRCISLQVNITTINTISTRSSTSILNPAPTYKTKFGTFRSLEIVCKIYISRFNVAIKDKIMKMSLLQNLLHQEIWRSSGEERESVILLCTAKGYAASRWNDKYHHLSRSPVFYRMTVLQGLLHQHPRPAHSKHLMLPLQFKPKIFISLLYQHDKQMAAHLLRPYNHLSSALSFSVNCSSDYSCKDKDFKDKFPKSGEEQIKWMWLSTRSVVFFFTCNSSKYRHTTPNYTSKSISRWTTFDSQFEFIIY